MNPTILTNYIDQLFASLEDKYPQFAGILAWANAQTDIIAIAVAANLGTIGVWGADAVLTALIDGATASHHPVVAAALKFIKTLVDQTGAASLPKLTAA